MPTKDDLKYLQNLPLDLKVMMTKARIREWISHFGEDGVYISFSGGKDSTVLLHLVREEFPDVEAVFVNTGLEYPEIQKFVKSFENVTILRPKMSFFGSYQKIWLSTCQQGSGRVFAAKENSLKKARRKVFL